MLIVRGIKVGEVKIGDLPCCAIRILLEDLAVTFKLAEYWRGERDVSQDAQERIRAAAAELTNLRVSILVEPLEDTRRVRVD